MGSISNFLEGKLLDHIFNQNTYTPPSTVYIGLSTADPTEDGSGLAEPTGGSYAREAITFGAASSRRVTQDAKVTFTKATDSWGTISHWALFDAQTSGNMLAYGSITTPKDVNTNATASIAASSIYVEFSAGYISDYLANILLDFAFRNQSYTPPTTYIALTTATISDSDTGSSITEPSGNGYSREIVEPYGTSGSSPTWGEVSNSVVSNSDDIVFGPASGGSWGTIVAAAIVDDESGGGNLLFYDNGVVDQEVNDTDTYKFLAGDFTCSLD